MAPGSTNPKPQVESGIESEIGYGQGEFGVIQFGGASEMTQTASITLVAYEEGEVTAQINDKGGDGVQGYDVTLSATDGSGFTVTETTDSSGGVVFSELKVREYDVHGVKAGWLDVSGTVPEGDFTSN